MIEYPKWVGVDGPGNPQMPGHVLVEDATQEEEAHKTGLGPAHLNPEQQAPKAKATKDEDDKDDDPPSDDHRGRGRPRRAEAKD